MLRTRIVGVAVLLMSRVVAAEEPAPFETAVQTVRDRSFEGYVVESHVYAAADGRAVLHGLWSVSRADGTPLGGGRYEHGVKSGVWGRWFGPGFGTGDLFITPQCAEFGVRFFSEVTFVEDRLEGAWTIYDAGRRKVSEWSFHKGIQNGPWIWYYPNGQKRHEAHYAAGKRHGAEIDYAPDGAEIARTEYVEGRRRIAHVELDPEGSGRRLVEGSYLDVEEVLATKYDWWAGSGASVPVQTEGKELSHGPWTWYHANGNKSVEGSYDRGAQVGEWNWYHEDGSLKTRQSFASSEPQAKVEQAVAEPSASSESIRPLEKEASAVNEPVPQPGSLDDPGARRGDGPATPSESAPRNDAAPPRSTLPPNELPAPRTSAAPGASIRKPAPKLAPSGGAIPAGPAPSDVAPQPQPETPAAAPALGVNNGN